MSVIISRAECSELGISPQEVSVFKDYVTHNARRPLEDVPVAVRFEELHRLGEEYLAGVRERSEARALQLERSREVALRDRESAEAAERALQPAQRTIDQLPNPEDVGGVPRPGSSTAPISGDQAREEEPDHPDHDDLPFLRGRIKAEPGSAMEEPPPSTPPPPKARRKRTGKKRGRKKAAKRSKR